MRKQVLISIVLIEFLINACSIRQKEINHSFILLSGELDSSSIILQCRFAQTDRLINNDISGSSGISCFQISKDSSFVDFLETNWLKCSPKNDFIIKKKIEGLQSATQYFYRAKAVIKGISDTVFSQTGTFKTFQKGNNTYETSFAISTGFRYEAYYGIGNSRIREPYKPAKELDRELGFEAFETVKNFNVDFFIANGDVVYYDKPSDQPELWARSIDQLRAKWHRYFSMPRNRQMCLQIPVYYLKDDHDYRFNDSDTTNQKFSEPSHKLGIDVFREQVPVTDPADQKAKTYRTHRVGKLLQLWFMEGRDYRSPNTMEDTPDKTIWGKEQKAWLKRTLLESNATFKILVSPTPIIGPDDAYKKDNHTNPDGFQSEGKAFIKWLTENDFAENNFFIICGDRHWQYYSIHPAGIEEFSCGAFINQNSRPGRLPGDPKSTDPDALLTVPYIQTDQWGGGFLYVKTYLENDTPFIKFSFHNVNGDELYSVKKSSN